MCTLSNGLTKGFTLKEKMLAQTSFFAMIISGTAGISITDPVYVIPYIFIAWYGVPGIIQRHIVCPRCPHLYQYGDCLQVPASLTRMLVKKRKPPEFTSRERFVFRAIFVLIPAYPLYWVFQTPLPAALFTVSALCWYGGQLFYFCRRCRVRHCPFNRVRRWI